MKTFAQTMVTGMLNLLRNCQPVGQCVTVVSIVCFQ